MLDSWFFIRCLVRFIPKRLRRAEVVITPLAFIIVMVYFVFR